jgi:hypothetical protein
MTAPIPVVSHAQRWWGVSLVVVRRFGTGWNDRAHPVT